MSFAGLEQRVNTAVMRRLSNASAQVGAVAVTVIFDRDSVQIIGVNGGIDGTQPGAWMQSADVAARAIARNTQLVINGTTYYVQRLQPDGTGMTLLLLSLEPA